MTSLFPQLVFELIELVSNLVQLGADFWKRRLFPLIFRQRTRQYGYREGRQDKRSKAGDDVGDACFGLEYNSATF